MPRLICICGHIIELFFRCITCSSYQYLSMTISMFTRCRHDPRQRDTWDHLAECRMPMIKKYQKKRKFIKCHSFDGHGTKCANLVEFCDIAQRTIAAPFIRTVRIKGHQLQCAFLFHCDSRKIIYGKSHQPQKQYTYHFLAKIGTKQ